VRVGNGRPTRFAWISPGDVIHLSDSGPEIVFDPGGARLRGRQSGGCIACCGDATGFCGRASIRARVEPAALSALPSAVRQTPSITAYIVAAGAAVFLLVGLGVWLGGKGGSASRVDDLQTLDGAVTQTMCRHSRSPRPPNDPMQSPATLWGPPIHDGPSSASNCDPPTAHGPVQLGFSVAVGRGRMITTGDAARASP